MPYCPSCGSETTGGNYCTECGEALSVEPADAEEEAQPTRDQSMSPFGFMLSYPLANGWKPFTITALCLAFSWLIIPYFLVYGYAYRLGRTAIRGDVAPPGYDDWIGILTDGIILFVATLPVILALFVIAGIPFILGAVLESFGLIVLGILLYFLVIYVGAAVVPVFLATGSVTATYRGLQFLRFVGTVQHLKALIVIVFLSITLSVVFGIFLIGMILTIIGILFIPFVYLGFVTYTTLLPFAIFGHYYDESVDRERMPPIHEEDRLTAKF